MSKRVTIIAEAGVNHNGDLVLAKKLIDEASAARADFVKFQTFKADKIASRDAQKAVYQNRNVNDGDISQYAMLKKLEMPEHWHHELIKYAHEKKIGFLSTGFDEDSIDFLDTLGISFFKIPSGEITNKPYLQHVASKGKPVILSTGMANMEEVKAAIQVMKAVGLRNEDLTVLHCNTEYPTPMKDVNLLAMNAMERELAVKIGYSDHTLGIEVPIAAVALGAVAIEKHFTLDRSMTGPDHKASLEPDELMAMVKAIRNIEEAISGSGYKELSPSEKPNIVIARKSVHLRNDVNQGTIISSDLLIMKRPGDGISPMQIEQVIGKKLKDDLKAGAKIKWEDLA